MTIALFVFVSSHISIFIILIATSIPYCMYSNINHCDNGNMSSLVPIIPMMPKTQVMPRMTKILTIKIVFDIVYCIWYMGTWCKWKDLIYPCLHACLTENDYIVMKDKTSEPPVSEKRRNQCWTQWGHTRWCWRRRQKASERRRTPKWLDGHWSSTGQISLTIY